MQTIQKTFQYGKHKVVLETGRIARQADGAVLASMADTVVLVTVVARPEANPGQGFFPLTVNYQERTYSAGKIPGGFFKREGRPSEKEILVSRLIDRPVRPLFPSGFLNEVQIIATVVSLDPDVDADIPAMLGAAAALQISGIPFSGPLGAARVGFLNNEYVLNPTFSELAGSILDLVVAGTEDSVLMVESEAKLLTEEQMLGAVMYGHGQMQIAIRNIKELGEEAGKPRWEWQAEAVNDELVNSINERFQSELESAYAIAEKPARRKQIEDLLQKAIAEFSASAAEDDAEDDEQVAAAQIKHIFKDIEKNIVRTRILRGDSRIDGRDTRTVRPLDMSVGTLPRAHGSALFTRGETQAMVATTLGTTRDAQIIDAIEGETREGFMLHYNFPPYSVGETGFMGSPKRREIGHGKLARRGLAAVMPDKDDFPYVIRVVSEVTESNGSSSMATICGAVLSLLDAGVPIKAPVAGVAMGLILGENKFAVLTDILGDEDHLGDMDFKVAGTKAGISALQMDIKTEGITPEIMAVALQQAKDGRVHILDEMLRLISEPNEMSKYAPRLFTMTINPDSIRDVIGKGGATIRSITEETGATVDIEDTGVITIASADQDAADRARARIEELTAEVEVGKIYTGTVAKIMDFGAFVTILPGRDGLVHISQISAGRRVNKVTDELSEGDTVDVKVLEIDRQGRVRLSMKEARPDYDASSDASTVGRSVAGVEPGDEGVEKEVEVGKIYTGTVARIMDFGAFVTILPGRDGLVHISQISAERRINKVSDEMSEGDTIDVKVLGIDRQGRIKLSIKEVVAEINE